MIAILFFALSLSAYGIECGPLWSGVAPGAAPPEIVQVSEAFALLSGGKYGQGERGPGFTTGVSGGVYRATVKVGETEQDAVEKEIPFDDLARASLALDFAKQAAARGMAPKVLGYVDVRVNGKKKRLLYTEEFAAGEEVVLQGKLDGFLSGLESSDLPGSLREKAKAAAEQRATEIRAFHPDPKDQNLLCALVKRGDGYAVLVQGVDWDYPFETLAPPKPVERQRSPRPFSLRPGNPDFGVPARQENPLRRDPVYVRTLDRLSRLSSSPGTVLGPIELR
jgi:hypothetical protein